MTRQGGLLQPAALGATWISRVGNAIADLLFPPRCVACHRLEAWLCEGCLAQVDAIRPPVCARCGLPVAPDAAVSAVCAHEDGAFRHLDGLRSCAFHSGPLREAIHAYKYAGLRALAAPLGELMARAWPTLAPGVDVDAVVAVPLHAARERGRGYNQSALLAREIGRRLGRPVVDGALVRTRATAPQIDLKAEQRRTNVRGAFHCRAPVLAGKRVLLVDDVCTTGSTLDEAAAALRAADVPAIWALTLARARL